MVGRGEQKGVRWFLLGAMDTVGSPGELPFAVPFGASHGKKPKPCSSQLARDMELALGLRTRSRKSHLLPQILPPNTAGHDSGR